LNNQILVEKHQQIQQQIQNIQSQVQKNDQTLEEIVKKLKDAESKLISATAIGKQRMKAINDSEKCNLICFVNILF
jgi:hypothetical protein